MKTRFLLISCIMGLLSGSNVVLAVDWKTVDLSGEFEGYSDTKGSGKRSYSFALTKTVEQGGDIMFSLNFGSSKETVAVIDGGYFLDLGSLSSPPTAVTVPKDFIAYHYKYQVRAFLIGHYYYMNKDSLHVLIQITDFAAGPRTTLSKNWAGGTNERATGRLSFRYVSSDKGIADLNRILGGAESELADPSQTDLDRQPKQIFHIVESGQSLVSIAQAYNIPIKRLMNANNLTMERVRVGQRIVIPARNESDEPVLTQNLNTTFSDPDGANSKSSPATLVVRLNSLHHELTTATTARLQSVLDSQEPEVALSQFGAFISECNSRHPYFLLGPSIIASTNDLAGRKKKIEADQAVAKPDMQESYRNLLQQINVLEEQFQRETAKMQILRNQMTALSEAILERQKLYKESSELLGAGPARESLKGALRPIAKAWMTPQLKQTGQN